MVVEPRLHFDEGLERLTQFRLTDGMDVVILSAGRAAKAGCSRDPAIDIHFFALEHRVLLRDALSLGIIVDPLHWLLRVPVGVIGRSGAGVSGESVTRLRRALQPQTCSCFGVDAEGLEELLRLADWGAQDHQPKSF